MKDIYEKALQDTLKYQVIREAMKCPPMRHKTTVTLDRESNSIKISLSTGPVLTSTIEGVTPW